MRGALCVLLSGSRATPEPTEQEIREAANAYLKALSRRGWTGVCSTLATSEERYFDRLGDGNCERVFRASGRRMGEAGWDDVYMRLYAIEEDGRWGIARSKKRRERYPIESLSPPSRDGG